MKKWTINRVDKFLEIKKVITQHFRKNVFSRKDSLTDTYSDGTFFIDYRKKQLLKYNYFLDLDNFKKVNDNLGPIQASNVLASFISQLNLELTNYKTRVYRLGGDEFIVSSNEIVEHILMGCKHCFTRNHNKFVITCSTVRLDLSFRDKIDLEDELRRGHSIVKRLKKRKKQYDLFVS